LYVYSWTRTFIFYIILHIYIFVSGKETETRWQNVRDGFNKYRRKLKCRSGNAAKSVKVYKYANALSFLTPYLSDRPTSSNFAEESDDDLLQPDNLTDEEDDASEESDLLPGQDCPVTPSDHRVASTNHSKLKQKRTKDDLDATLCEYLKKKSSTPVKADEKQDDVDLFLMSMAESIRKLPARKRAEVKFKIHSIVHEAEMQSCFPQMMTTFGRQSMDERPYLTSTRVMTSTVPDIQPMDSQPTIGSNMESAFQGFHTYTQYLNDQ